MNHRDEDLIRLAFGEHDAPNASLDATQQREVDGYRQMAQDLKGLRDIPEMQMSKERLREAILQTGLKETRRPFWLSPFAAWVPVGAAAVLAVLYVMRDPGGVVLPMPTGGNPIVIEKQSSLPETTTVALRMPDFERPVLTERVFQPVAEFRPMDSVPEAPTATPRRARQSEARRVVSSGELKTAAKAKAIVAEAAPAVTTMAADAAVAPMTEASQPEEPLVMIGSEKNLGNGTSIAVEVHSDSNVVVGG